MKLVKKRREWMIRESFKIVVAFILIIISTAMGSYNGRAEEEQQELTTMAVGGFYPPDNFDWDQLNQKDHLDLQKEGFKESKENVPVKLTGGSFDQSKRRYYMFIGTVGMEHVFNDSTGKFASFGAMNRPINPNETFPIISPSLIGYNPDKSTNPRSFPFGYSYPYSKSFGDSRSSQSTFVVGTMNNDGSIAEDSVMESAPIGRLPGVVQAPFGYLVKEYVKDNEMVAYGWITLSNNTTKASPGDSKTISSYVPVRIHSYIVNRSAGRVRYELSFLNNETSNKTYAIHYGIHIDIAGAHEASQLYFNGKNGLYFDQTNTKPVVDQIPAKIYFYTGSDYEDNNGPTAYNYGRFTDFATPYFWRLLDKTPWATPISQSIKNPYAPWSNMEDHTVGSPTNMRHPVCVYRWDPVTVKPGEVGSVALDMAIDENTPLVPTADKSFKNLTSTNDKNHVGDMLEFSLKLWNNGESTSWEDVTVVDKLPEDLQIDTNSIVFEDPDGKQTKVSPSSYNASTRELKVGSYDIAVKKNYAIKFKAKIIGNGDKTIVNTMQAKDLTGHDTDASVSIPVEKVLKANLVVKFMNGSTQLNAPITINDVVGKKINLATNEKVKPILDKLLKDYNFTSKPDDTAVPIKDGGSEFVYQFTPRIASLKVYFKLGNQTIDPTTGMLTASDAYLPFEGKVGEKFDLSKDSSITAALGRIDQYYDLETAPGPIVTFDPSLKQVVYQFKQGKGTWHVKYLEKGTNKVLGKEYTVALDAGSEYNMGNDPNVKSMLEDIKNKHYTLSDINGDTKFLVTKKGGTITYYFEADKGVLNVYFKDSDNNSINPTTGAVTTAPKPITIDGKIYDTIDLQKQSPIVSALKALDQYFDIDSEQTPDQKVTLMQSSQDFTYVLNRAKAPWTIRFLEDGTNKQLRKNLVLSKPAGMILNVDKDKGIQDALKEINDQYYQVVRTEGDRSVQLTKQGATFTYYFKADEGTLNVNFISGDKKIDPATGEVNSGTKPLTIRGEINKTIDLKIQPAITVAFKVLDKYFDIDLDKTPDQKVVLTQPNQDFTYVLTRAKVPWTIRFLEDGTNKQLRDDLVLSKDTGWEWNVNTDKGIKAAVKEMNDQYYRIVRTEGIGNVQLTKDGATFTYYFQAELGTVKVRFQNVKGEELSDPVEVAGRISSTVSLADDTAVKAKLDELAKQGYTTTQNPQVKIEETETEYVFVLSDGDFSLKSAPEMLEFNDYHTGVYGKVTAANPDWANHPLVVTDTRVHPEGWEVKVQMTQDLTSQEDQDFSLKNVLYYKRDDSKTPLSKGSGAVVIYDNKADKKTGNIDISKLEWKDKGNGFSIELKNSQYRKLGNYNAKLLYTLEKTP